MSSKVTKSNSIPMLMIGKIHPARMIAMASPIGNKILCARLCTINLNMIFSSLHRAHQDDSVVLRDVIIIGLSDNDTVSERQINVHLPNKTFFGYDAGAFRFPSYSMRNFFLSNEYTRLTNPTIVGERERQLRRSCLRKGSNEKYCQHDNSLHNQNPPCIEIIDSPALR